MSRRKIPPLATTKELSDAGVVRIVMGAAVRVQRRVRRLELRVIEAARKSAAMITKAHNGDESNIADENRLVETVEALDKAEGKTHNA